MSYITRTLGLVAVLFLVSFAVACGGGDEATVPDTTATTETPATPEAKRLVLFQYRFNPNTLTIPAGTTVTFANKDPERHNVRIAALNIDQMIEPNAEWSYTFNTTGEFAVDNRLATNPMNATIIVE